MSFTVFIILKTIFFYLITDLFSSYGLTRLSSSKEF